jgi:hypothetical protein
MAAVDSLNTQQFGSTANGTTDSSTGAMGAGPTVSAEPWDGPEGSTGQPGGTSGGIAGLGMASSDGQGSW